MEAAFVVSVDQQGVWLCEKKTQNSHATLVWLDTQGHPLKQTAENFDVGSRLNMHGDSPAIVVDSVAFFVNRLDGQPYMWHGGGAPRRLFHADTDVHNNYEFGALEYDKARKRLVAVVESKDSKSQQNANPKKQSLIAISIFGDNTPVALLNDEQNSELNFSVPRFSPTGSHVAWTEWAPHESPWKRTTLRIARVNADGSFGTPTILAGSDKNESIIEPQWSPSGELYWISNASGNWNLYKKSETQKAECVWPMNADFIQENSNSAGASFGFFDLNVLVCRYYSKEKWHLAVLDCSTSENTNIPSALDYFSSICTSPRHAAFLASSAMNRPAVHVLTRNFQIRKL